MKCEKKTATTGIDLSEGMLPVTGAVELAKATGCRCTAEKTRAIERAEMKSMSFSEKHQYNSRRTVIILNKPENKNQEEMKCK